jgi:hypothetical protein
MWRDHEYRVVLGARVDYDITPVDKERRRFSSLHHNGWTRCDWLGPI